MPRRKVEGEALILALPLGFFRDSQQRRGVHRRRQVRHPGSFEEFAAVGCHAELTAHQGLGGGRAEAHDHVGVNAAGDPRARGARAARVKRKGLTDGWNGLKAVPYRFGVIWNGLKAVPYRLGVIWNGLKAAPYRLRVGDGL